jgi:tetratricopeptide (TPR) repeat protein
MEKHLVKVMLVGLVLLGGVARAQGETDTARQRTATARAHFNLGEYNEALADFRAAYRSLPSAELLFNIAQCQRLLKRYDEALRSYRAFLNEMTDEEMISRDAVERLIVQMRELAAAQPPDGVSPLALRPSLASARPSDVAAPRAELTAATDLPAARPWYRRPTPLALSIGGVLTVAAGGALLGEANAAAGQARNATRLADVNRLHASDLQLQGAGWPLLGIGAASLAAGAVLVVLEWKGVVR